MTEATTILADMRALVSVVRRLKHPESIDGLLTEISLCSSRIHNAPGTTGEQAERARRLEEKAGEAAEDALTAEPRRCYGQLLALREGIPDWRTLHEEQRPLRATNLE